MNALDRHDYQHYRGGTTQIHYHFIWVPRRRKKVLVDLVSERLDALLRTKAVDLNLEILELTIHPDYLHLFVIADPRWSPAQIVFRLKEYTAPILRREFPFLQKMPSMWTMRYFCSTAGTVEPEVITQYLEMQGTRS